MLGKMYSITQFEQFVRLYKIFEEPPYNEFFTREEVKEIYDDLVDNGHLDGFFVDGVPVGCIGFRKMVVDEHPVKYEHPEKVAYFAEIIVVPEYRRKGIGTLMMKHMLEVLKNEGYTKVYMRTLNPSQSMSYGIAVQCGFNLMEGINQPVEGPRTVEDRDEIDIRIFLEKDL